MNLVTKFCCIVLFCFAVLGTAQAGNTVNKIVAVVNGEMITLHEVRTRIATDLAREQRTATQAEIDGMVASKLDAMINDILLLHEADRYKVSLEDTEIETEVRKMMLRNRMSQKAFEAQLIRQGTSLELVKEELRKGILRQRIATMMIARKVSVSKEDMEAYYNAHKAELVTPKMVDFSIIVFAPKVPPEAVRAAILAGEISFEDAARKVSLDASAKDGGRVPGVQWTELTNQVQKVLDGLPLETISPVINIGGNKAIYMVHSIDPGGRQLSLQESSRKIEAILKEPLIQSRYDEYTRELRAKAVIDYRL